jgi:hypothetical protein
LASKQELFAAVLADPSHDAPRLAYATELRREGDVSGELIELEIAAKNNRLPEARRDRYLSLRYTASDMLFGAVCPPASGAQLDRGMVGGVTISVDALLGHAPELFAAAPLQSLTLTNAGGRLDRLGEIAGLAQIRSLGLASNQLVDDDIRALTQCPLLGQVRWLELTDNRLGRDALEALCQARHFGALEILSFNANRVESPVDRWNATEYNANDVANDNFNPALQAELEKQFGRQRWLHPPPGWSLRPNKFSFTDDDHRNE